MVEITMAQNHLWEDNSKLKDYLAHQLLSGRLALVLGAGISFPFGLPKWKELISRLYVSKYDTPPKDLNPGQQVESFKLKYFEYDDEGYLDSVYAALYEIDNVNFDFETLRRNNVISALGSLIMASTRGNIANIVTFNYDNLLEIYLRYHGFTVNSFFKESHWAQRSDVTMYYPHGYLPIDKQAERSKKIILDQASYSKVIVDKGSIWYQIMLTIFRTHTCLFLGLSGEDQNLDALLLASKEKHAYTEDQTAYWGVRFTEDANGDRTRIWKERGIFTKMVSIYEHELAPFLFDICQKAAEIVIER